MMATAGLPQVPRGADDEMPVDDQVPTTAEQLMNAPDSASQAAAGTRIPRATATYRASAETYVPPADGHRQQYAGLYYTRLMKMRPMLLANAKRKWGNDVRVANNILNLEAGVECVLIGTLYKHMQLKPSALAEYAQERFVEPLPPRAKHVHEDDELILEDQTGRVKLAGNIPVGELVTGIVIAVLGCETAAGDFDVKEWCFGGLPPQQALPGNAGGDATYVALVSGWNIGPENPSPLAVQLLVDYITGSLGGPNEQMFGSKIVRTIVAGNAMGEMPQQKEMARFKANKTADMEKEAEYAALREIDSALAQIASNCPVDLMPGDRDPANFNLPQQPMHPCLFLTARTYSTFNTVTNPHCPEINGVKFIGTSGQNVQDILRFSTMEDAHAAAECTLKWSHLAPTAPDTLGCYPFTTDDPFVVDACPHVLFVGNQPEYATSVLEGEQGQRVRVVSVPAFAAQPMVVLVNLATLQCHPISFAVDTL